MRNTKKIIILLLSLITIILIASFVYNSNKKNHNPPKNNNSQTSKKEYKHTFWEKIVKNDFFKWEFIANDVISVYPRRDAIVKDILVDIWDRVKPWDTLAILFNSWVEWEAQSRINNKDTILEAKHNLLNETINLKNSKIEEIDQKIIEKESILQETVENFNKKISQIWDKNTNWSEYQVELKSLEILNTNLENAKNSKKEILEDIQNNINQKNDLLLAKIEDTYNKLIPILYIWNEQRIEFNSIDPNDISSEFWAKNSKTKDELIQNLENYNKNYKSLEVNKNYSNLLKIIDLFNINLQNSVISTVITNKNIENNINLLNSLKSWLISQKEILDDAIKSYSINNSIQNEKIQNLEIAIDKKLNEISLLSTKSSTLESDKNLNISKLIFEIENLKKSRNVLIANEQKNIVTIQNDINIAKSDLNSEFIKSWDYKIIASFWWTITKRNIEIWEKISPNNEAFRLSWVNNSLSKITKKEVKFFVPQELKDEISLNKEIYFDLWNEQKSYTWTIYRISPEIDENTLSIIVQAKVDENLKIPNKSTLRVWLETSQNIFKIPTSTIYDKNNRKIIYYKKDNSKLWIRDITIISEDWEYSYVTWKIDEKLKIVTTPIFIK